MRESVEARDEHGVALAQGEQRSRQFAQSVLARSPCRGTRARLRPPSTPIAERRAHARPGLPADSHRLSRVITAEALRLTQPSFAWRTLLKTHGLRIYERVLIFAPLETRGSATFRELGIKNEF
jgi:hypothetical protein